MKVLVLGASTNPNRYAYIATNMLLDYEHEVELVGLRSGEVRGIEIQTGLPQIEGIDTVTLYVGPQRQEPLYDYILGLKPNRVIFNPGTENPELIKKCEEVGIVPEIACTLVLLRINQFE